MVFRAEQIFIAYLLLLSTLTIWRLQISRDLYCLHHCYIHLPQLLNTEITISPLFLLCNLQEKKYSLINLEVVCGSVVYVQNCYGKEFCIRFRHLFQALICLALLEKASGPRIKNIHI